MPFPFLLLLTSPLYQEKDLAFFDSLIDILKEPFPFLAVSLRQVLSQLYCVIHSQSLCPSSYPKLVFFFCFPWGRGTESRGTDIVFPLSQSLSKACSFQIEIAIYGKRTMFLYLN